MANDTGPAGPMLPAIPRDHWRGKGAAEFAMWAGEIADQIARVATINDLREIGDRIAAKADDLRRSADAWEPHGEAP